MSLDGGTTSDAVLSFRAFPVYPGKPVRKFSDREADRVMIRSFFVPSGVCVIRGYAKEGATNGTQPNYGDFCFSFFFRVFGAFRGQVFANQLTPERTEGAERRRKS
ncbi:MAG TPA: hypothetical protein VNA22_05495 [Pyrinomonadaceae bacterium]|nr:hypothetical protein [Pyrinomonadaceae bacterium]